MKTHSDAYKEEIKTFGRQIDSKITYSIDGVSYELGAENLNSITPHYESSLLKSVMKQLDIDSNTEIPLETVINYRFGLLVDGSYEYVDYGNYVVYSVEKQEDTDSYKIICYDKMLYSMKDYESLGVTYPITVKNFLVALCNKVGLTFKDSNFANQDREIRQEMYLDTEGNSLGYTYRDVFDELAQVTGSVICINNDDEVEVRYVNNTGEYETQEGTGIEIENVDEGRNIEIELYGDTSQETTTGKNLFNVNGSYSVSSCTASRTNDVLTQTNTGTYCRTMWQIENLVVGQKYTLSYDFVNDNGCSIQPRIMNSTNSTQKASATITTDTSGSTTLTFTATETTHWIRLYSNTLGTSNSYVVVYNNIQLEQNEEKTEYEPYTNGASPNPNFPQEVETVTGKQEITINGKNLFEDEYIPVLSNHINARLKQGSYVLSMEDKTIISGLQLKLFDKNGNLLTGEEEHISFTGGVTNHNTAEGIYTFSYIFTPRYYYCKFTLDGDYDVAIGLSNSDNTKKIMLNKGTTVLDYEPYIEKNYEIDLAGENLLNIRRIIKGRLDSGVIGYQGNVTNLTLNNDNFSFTTNANWRGVTTEFIETEGSMRISYENLNSEFSLAVACYDRNMAWKGNGTVSGNASEKSRSISVISGTKYVRLYFALATAGTITIVNPMLVQGTTVKSYERYKKIELCKIGDYQDYIRKSTGKNLINQSKVTTGKLLSQTIGEEATFTDNTNWTTVIDYIPVEYGQSYVMSRAETTNGQFIFGEFDENKKMTKRANQTLNNVRFYKYTISEQNTKYLMVGYREDFGHTNIQLEQGEEATDYEPFGEKWYIYKEIGKNVFNGEETWSYGSSGETGISVAHTLIDNMLSGNYIDGLSSHFHNDKTGKAKNSIRFGANTNRIYTYFDETLFTNVDNYKAWLINHFPQVYYPLATPTVTEITDEELISQLESIYLLEGVNKIEITSDTIATPLKLTYLKELDTIDEEYLKDVNVNFGEKYGPINSLVLSRSAGSDNIYLQDEASIEENGLCEIKIEDNQIMNSNDRADYLPELFAKLNGLEYHLNDFSSTGITYYDLLDRYKITVGNNNYKCIMFNDEVDVTQGLEEQVHTEIGEESETDYTKADKTDRRIKQAYIIVDKQNNRIDSVVSDYGDLNKKLYGDEATGQVGDIVSLGTQVSQKVDSVEFDVYKGTVDDMVDNGVKLVKTTSVTINDEGLNVSTNTSKISTTMTNNEFKITDSGNTKLAYFGYDEEEGISKAEMDNLTVTNYFVAGVHRIETMNVDGEERTGFFYIGG